jgi:hypothetical protein
MVTPVTGTPGAAPADRILGATDAETLLQMANSGQSVDLARRMLQQHGVRGARLQNALDAYRAVQVDDTGSGDVHRQLGNALRQVATGQNYGQFVGTNSTNTPVAQVPTAREWSQNGNARDQTMDYQRYLNGLNAGLGRPALDVDGIVGPQTIGQARDAYSQGKIPEGAMRQLEAQYQRYPGSATNRSPATVPLPPVPSPATPTAPTGQPPTASTPSEMERASTEMNASMQPIVRAAQGNTGQAINDVDDLRQAQGQLAQAQRRLLGFQPGSSEFAAGRQHVDQLNAQIAELQRRIAINPRAANIQELERLNRDLAGSYLTGAGRRGDQARSDELSLRLYGATSGRNGGGYT